jgi:hypothetical protein
MLTNSVWGREEISEELKEKLSKYYVQKDDDGNEFVSKSSLWGELAFYTRDIRLGNLSSWDGELRVCRFWLDIAGDFLRFNMIEPFLISLSRAATIIETSQSKGGFVRKMGNTIRREDFHQEIPQPKKGLMGGGDKENNQGGY